MCRISTVTTYLHGIINSWFPNSASARLWSPQQGLKKCAAWWCFVWQRKPCKNTDALDSASTNLFVQRYHWPCWCHKSRSTLLKTLLSLLVACWNTCTQCLWQSLLNRVVTPASRAHGQGVYCLAACNACCSSLCLMAYLHSACRMEPSWVELTAKEAEKPISTKSSPTMRWTLPQLSTANCRRLLNISVNGSSHCVLDCWWNDSGAREWPDIVWTDCAGAGVCWCLAVAMGWLDSSSVSV